MRLKTLIVFVLLSVFLLAGCSSGAKSITINDLSIHKVGDSNSKVTYGMSRADAEKVLGNGEKSDHGYNYNNGVRVYYRDDKVVGVSLGEAAKGIYETTSGVQIGMLESEAKRIYGDKYASDASDGGNLGYFYDTANKLYLKKDDLFKNSKEEYEKVFGISILFDENGYAYRVSLWDQRMAMFMN